MAQKTSPPKASDPARPGMPVRITGKDDMAETNAARKRRSLEMMSKRYQSQELCSESESFVERLYAPSEKLTERYQSQEFVPLHVQPPTTQPQKPPQTPPKPQKGKAPQPPTSVKPKAPQPPPKPAKPKMTVTQPLMQALLKHMKQPGVAEAAAKAAEDEEVQQDPSTKSDLQQVQEPKTKPPPPPIPSVPPITSPTDLPETEIGPPQEKPLAKHHSYDDKTLSKSQIREYKTNKVRQSNSFHEHMLTQSQQSSMESMPPRIDEESSSVGGGASAASSHTTTTTTVNSGNTTSAENSSPMLPTRAEKLVKCSPYYSSSLSSESPPNQLIQKPPRKGSISRAPIVKSPPSGNDTDSSVDVRAQDPKLRTRGYRKKRQITAKRIRSSDRNLVEQESSECSEGYMPEMDSGGSDPSYRHEYYEFDEELEEREQETDEYDDYPHYSGVAFSSTSSAFESLDMTDNVDEMGFPRYDRLSHITNPIYQQSLHHYQQHQQQQQRTSSSVTSTTPTSCSRPAPANHPMPPPSGQPIKPARTKKRQLKREDSVMGSQQSSSPYSSQYHGRSYCNPEESEFETKGGLSDDMANSSEDSNNSFYHCTGTIKRSAAAAAAAAAAKASSSTGGGSIGCGSGASSSGGSVSQPRRKSKSSDIDLPYPDFLSDYETEPIEYERFACGLDIRVDPPPKFHDSDDLSDQ